VNGPLVLKLGGELIESAAQRDRIAAAIAMESARRPVVVVHGGGRAIDAELDRRGIAPRKVDGLRATDEATLGVVVAVLAGEANTALVASLVGRGVRAVGLTGVDAALGRATRVSAYRTSSGDIADLGHVGDPTEVDPALLELLLVHGYVPVVASIGIADSGRRTEDHGRGATPEALNVNADVMGCRIAAALAGSDLVIAGTTPGVLDASGTPIDVLDPDAIEHVIASGTATAGMIAKLSACREALDGGVATVRIVDGRGLDANHGIDQAPGTVLAPPAVQTT
jgi:acetylglutamate kinase